MTVATVAPGTAIFLDANIFIYSITGDPQYGAPCSALLKRVEDGELQGHTSAAVLSDVAHRLMTLEAIRTLGWPYQGIARRLRRHPEEVKRLNVFRRAVEHIAQSDVTVSHITPELVERAVELSQLHGLLANDALVLGAMESAGVTALASNDADFDRVPNISRIAPA